MCNPQPLLGGDMDNNVVLQLTRALAGAGLPVMRFNYRSVGRSHAVEKGLHRFEYWNRLMESGAFGALQEAGDEALRRAHRLFAPTLFCGYSFGAYVALETARRHAPAKPLVLVAPPITRLPFDTLSEHEGPSLLLFAAQDRLDPPPPAAELASRFRNSTIAVVPDSDHFFIHREQSYLPAVISFLTTHGVLESQP